MKRLDVSTKNHKGAGTIESGRICSETKEFDIQAQMYVDALQALEQGVVIYDAEDNFVYCNQIFREFYPLVTPALIPGESFRNILHYAVTHGQLVEAEHSEDEWVTNRLATRRKHEADIERTLPDGRVLRLRERILPNGALMEVHTDITKEFLFEEKLRNLIAGAEICTWEWNVTTQEHRVNEYWAALLGYRLEELSPVTFDTWRQRVHPDDLEATEAQFNKLFESPHLPYKAEYRLRHKAGHWIWVLDTGRTLRWNANGTPDLITGVQVDISEQHARETALTAMKAELERSMAERAQFEQRLIDIATVSDGWRWEMDRDRRFIFVLDGDYFDDGGVPKEGLIGKTQEQWLDANPDMRAGIEWESLLKTIREHRPFRPSPSPPGRSGRLRWRGP